MLILRSMDYTTSALDIISSNNETSIGGFAFFSKSPFSCGAEPSGIGIVVLRIINLNVEFLLTETNGHVQSFLALWC